jgi:hypothetical protein
MGTERQIAARVRTLYASAAWFAAENPQLREGELGTEKETGRTKIGDGVTPWAGLPYLHRRSKSFAVTAPTAGMPRFGFRLDAPARVERVTAVVSGSGPAVTFALRHGPSIAGPGVELVTGGIACSSTTTGDEVLIFDNPNVAAGSWLWADVVSVGGAVDSLSVTIDF